MPLILAVAMALDAILGEPKWLWSRLPHPAVLLGRAIRVLDQRLNHAPAQRLRGVLAVVTLVAGAWAIGWAVSLGGPVVECLAAAVLLAQKSLTQHVSAVATGLRKSTQAGRQAVAMIVSRDTADMDPAHVARSAIESAAENLSDGVIAPAFWFLIGGVPGILIYKVVNTADSMIGYRTPQYADFGWAAARLDDLLNLVPARLTALLIALVYGKIRHWPAIAADAKRHRSPNAGWPEAATARVLGIALAGPRSYDGQMRDLAWVNGEGQRLIGATEIDAAVFVLWRVWAVVLVLVLLIALV